MKVVDMFGCGTPVLAKNFAAIGELVKDGKNGQVWSTGEELGNQIIVSDWVTSRRGLTTGLAQRLPAQPKIVATPKLL